jgi:hypothetical protein
MQISLSQSAMIIFAFGDSFAISTLFDHGRASCLRIAQRRQPPRKRTGERYMPFDDSSLQYQFLFDFVEITHLIDDSQLICQSATVLAISRSAAFISSVPLAIMRCSTQHSSFLFRTPDVCTGMKCLGGSSESGRLTGPGSCERVRSLAPLLAGVSLRSRLCCDLDCVCRVGAAGRCEPSVAAAERDGAL